MSTQIDQYTVNFPDWALCALINGDTSGLTEQDSQQLGDWEENCRVHLDDGQTISYSPGEPIGFNGWPEFGLACDCTELTVTVFAPDRVPENITVHLEFETVGAWFDTMQMSAANHAAEILRHVADQLQRGTESGPVKDGNGNTMGRFALEIKTSTTES